MLPNELELLTHFKPNEKDYYGKQVDWSTYHFRTVQELNRLRGVIGHPCELIRGDHGYLKETGVDAVFPKAPFQTVVMACMRSGFSKGFYEGGSIHLDTKMGVNGLARCWIAFKAERREAITNRGLMGLLAYSRDNWDYYQWTHPLAWDLLSYLVEVNG